MRIIAAIIAGLGLLALAVSYGGALHPAADSMAVFRPVWAAVLILFGLLLRGRSRLFAVAIGLAALLPILWVMRPVSEPAGGIVVYQKNMRFDMQDHTPLIEDILQTEADIVLLAEVSAQNLVLPQRLHNSHPHQVICQAHPVGAVAILSRWPVADPVCPRGTGLVTAQVQTPEGAVSVAALHLHWPWPSIQAAQLQHLLPQLEALPQPAIVGGDFNMVPWSHSVAQVEAATGTDRVLPVRPSFTLSGVYPMPIDQILAPKGWQSQATMRDLLFSDHRGILARIAPPSGPRVGGGS